MREVGVGLCEDIITARRCGTVRCGIADAPVASVSELAAAFGLLPEAGSYREIDAVTAKSVLVRLLGHDMAYGQVAMPDSIAHQLADQFVTLFGPRARYFTNGDWHLNDAGYLGWEAVTDATFDGGVLALDSERSGCVWVEDND